MEENLKNTVSFRQDLTVNIDLERLEAKILGGSFIRRRKATVSGLSRGTERRG
jgi:hypothetical protein